jgi:hypothetical protein
MRRVIALAVATAGLAASAAPDRKQAIERGVRFIYRTACDLKNFADFGEDYLWCLYSIGATSRDPALARLALTMGRERAAVWQRQHPALPANTNADEISNLLFGAYAAEQLGLPDPVLKEQIRRAAPVHPVVDYLAFDPTREPPPGDVPYPCRRCSKMSPRGATICRHCGARLTMRSRYDILCDALVVTYTGDRYGVTLGAPYSAVIRWLPGMRPYRGREGGANPEYTDILYAVTHVVYTQNDYSLYRLSPRSLPDEFAYLKANLADAIVLHDPETMGEFLDCLKSFGLKGSDPLIRTGTEYLLSTQNPDGSWGDMKTDDIYLRYHPTWTAVDGLRDYKWKAASGIQRKMKITTGGY